VPTKPSELVGFWRVDGPDIPPGTVLKLAADERMFLFAACGVPFGRWRAVPGGAFSAIMTAAAADCPAIAGADEYERNTPVWLRSVVGFGVAGANRILLDTGGRTVATLVATTTAPGELMPGERVPPDPPTSADSTRLDTATPPPTGLKPAVQSDLTGHWIPTGVGPSSGQAYVDFAPNGSVKVFDGCNYARGRATVAPGGGFASTLYVSYIVACDNSPISDWLEQAAWADFDGPDLVLGDTNGSRLGTLRRTAQVTATPSEG
jgi:hypothetical protein